MNSYTVKQINELLNDKYYFFKERFAAYFSAMGKKPDQVSELWEIWRKFPQVEENNYEAADYLVEMLRKYHKCDTEVSFPLYEDKSKNIKKVYYRNDGDILNFTVNFCDKEDVIMYADFLKSKPDIITVVDFIETFCAKGGTVTVFDGDTYAIGGRWFANGKSSVILCYHGIYKKLLYTAGKGYIRNKKPDFDEGDFNYHVITLSETFHKVGNIFVDSSFLMEEKPETIMDNQ